MFLAAIARPLYDEEGHCVLDEKVGFWPFVAMVAAKRNSRIRPTGTLKLKPVNVTRDVYRSFIVEKVIPAIREKCPMRPSEPVVMQQDNTPCQVSIDVQIIVEEGRRHQWNIQMTNQPANSLVFDVLDLGFFRGLQSMQYKYEPRTTQELFEACKAAY